MDARQTRPSTSSPWPWRSALRPVSQLIFPSSWVAGSGIGIFAIHTSFRSRSSPLIFASHIQPRTDGRGRRRVPAMPDYMAETPADNSNAQN
jgi:hypothetical protein